MQFILFLCVFISDWAPIWGRCQKIVSGLIIMGVWQVGAASYVGLGVFPVIIYHFTAVPVVRVRVRWNEVHSSVLKICTCTSIQRISEEWKPGISAYLFAQFPYSSFPLPETPIYSWTKFKNCFRNEMLLIKCILYQYANADFTQKSLLYNLSFSIDWKSTKWHLHHQRAIYIVTTQKWNTEKSNDNQLPAAIMNKQFAISQQQFNYIL